MSRLSDKVRVFDFDPEGVSLRAALDVIDIALEDEGLHLVGRHNLGSLPGYAIRAEGHLRVIVPNDNIEENRP